MSCWLFIWYIYIYTTHLWYIYSFLHLNMCSCDKSQILFLCVFDVVVGWKFWAQNYAIGDNSQYVPLTLYRDSVFRRIYAKIFKERIKPEILRKVVHDIPCP